MRPGVLAALPRPVAWVFTGGGARAAAQVGIAEVLLEQGYRADLMAASSFGAINAAALRPQQPDQQHLRRMWEEIGEDSLFDSPGTAAVRAFGPRTGRSIREFHQIVARALGDLAASPLPDTLTIVASDLESGAPVTLSDLPTIDAVMATCSIPVLLPPTERDGRLLVDGGLTADAPIEQAADAGAAAIVLLDTGDPSVPPAAIAGMRWWQVAALSYSHQIRSQLRHSLPRVAARIPVVVISAEGGGILEFGEADERFRDGRRAAAVALARNLRDTDVSRPGVHGWAVPPQA